jgi:uncharacterized protein involved in cysteine biosynthesis
LCEVCAARGAAAGAGGGQRERRAGAGFLAGARCFGRGTGFLLQTPRTKRYAAIPWAIAAAIFAIAFYLLWNATDSLRHSATSAEWAPEWLRSAAAIFMSALFVALFALLLWIGAAVVTAAVAAPFLDVLVGRVDEVRFGRVRAVSASWFADFGFTAWQSVLLLVFLLPLNAAALIAAWIPPIGPFVSLFLISTAAGFAALDIAASRRRWTFGQKLAVAAASFPALLGFGLVAALVSTVPCLGWMLAIPVCATGGTFLLYSIDLGPARGK